MHVIKRRIIALVAALFLAGPANPVAAQADLYEDLFRQFSSASLTYDDKRFLQAALAFEGHYNGLLDGDWGGMSQRALEDFALQEFGSPAEEWHMAMLAFSFFDIYERDGWGMNYNPALGLSFLFPNNSAVPDQPTQYFVNWKHRNSTLAISIGVLPFSSAQNTHDFVSKWHETGSDDFYSVRRDGLAITASQKWDGSALYARSNLIEGAWSTVMLFAERRDRPILNAVAASIDVGRTRPLRLQDGGRLEATIFRALELAAEPAPNVSAKPTPDRGSAPSLSSGSGFFVSANGEVLTNAHVVNGCSSITVDGEAATLLAASNDFDLALLKVDSAKGPVASFSAAPAKLNSDVTVVGFPLSGLLGGINVTRGSISSPTGFQGDVTRMQITAPVQSGNSGGPVIGQDGSIIGVVVSKLDAAMVAEDLGDTPQNVNFAIRGEIAKLFLTQHGIEPVLTNDSEAVEPTELAEKAQSFTTYIECERR